MKITFKGPGIKLSGICTPEIGAKLLKIVEGNKKYKVKVKRKKK